MQLISEEQFNYLTKTNLSNAISLLIPTHRRSTPENKYIDLTNYKNQLGIIDQNLNQLGFAPAHIKRILQKAYSLIYEDNFWNDLSDGLAVYIEGGQTHTFKVPIYFENFTYINDHFYIKPLMPLLTGDGKFFILSLSQNQVKFFEGTRYTIAEVKINDLVPLNIEMAIGEAVYEPTLQSHSAYPNQSAIFHGQGGGKDYHEINLRNFLSKVDNGLMEMLHDESAPLILASVDELAASYRQISNYPFVFEETIKGNPENVSSLLLHEKAWKFLEEKFQQPFQQHYLNFQDNIHQKNSSTDPHVIFKRALEGRVEHIFTRNDSNLWGNYKQDSHRVDIHSSRENDSSCLLNLATIYTLNQGGIAYNIPPQNMPMKDAKAAATFRF